MRWTASFSMPPLQLTIRNDQTVTFCHNSWLDGEAPRNLAPHLFALVKRENRTVKQELSNNTRIKALRGKITSATHVEEFVTFWIYFQDVYLLLEIPDKITWKWMRNGNIQQNQHTMHNS